MAEKIYFFNHIIKKKILSTQKCIILSNFKFEISTKYYNVTLKQFTLKQLINKKNLNTNQIQYGIYIISD